MSIKEVSHRFFSYGHERTLRAKKNIVALFIIKGLNIFVGLLLVPLTINYVDPTRYGVWITLSSIIGWFGFFDIGLGHGLRNRFAQALAKGHHELARIYVSTTYAIISIIIGGILLIFYFVNPLINWNIILNAGHDIVLQKELSALALVVFTFFCLRLIFNLIGTILTADQKPAKASLFDLLEKIIALMLIFILLINTEGNLLYLGVAMSVPPVFVLILASVWFFNSRYKIYKPSIKTVDFGKSGLLLSLGVKFFIIQISAVILYSTNNIIISHLFGPEQVTSYNIAFKYFSVLMMGFTIVISPFWSAFTEAWAKQEIQWIKNIVRRLMIIWTVLFAAAIVMLISSSWVYSLWIGDKVNVLFTTSALVCLWNIIIAWNAVFVCFLNGVGKISLQLLFGVFAAIINIPLAIFLGKIIGIEGIFIGNILLSLITVFIYPIQYKKLLNGKASGIFNR